MSGDRHDTFTDPTMVCQSCDHLFGEHDRWAMCLMETCPCPLFREEPEQITPAQAAKVPDRSNVTGIFSRRNALGGKL